MGLKVRDYYDAYLVFVALRKIEMRMDVATNVTRIVLIDHGKRKIETAEKVSIQTCATAEEKRSSGTGHRR